MSQSKRKILPLFFFIIPGILALACQSSLLASPSEVPASLPTVVFSLPTTPTPTPDAQGALGKAGDEIKTGLGNIKNSLGGLLGGAKKTPTPTPTPLPFLR